MYRNRSIPVALALAASLAAPNLALAQTRSRPSGSSGTSTGQKAVPRTDGGSPTTSGGRSSTPPSSGTRSGADSGGRTGGSTQTSSTRDRDREPDPGRAVQRTPDSHSGGTTVVVTRPGYWGGYYPWGYGGLGVGGYYGSLYDPWWYDDGYSASSYDGGYLGSLRLKMKPREAQVYVDGYFAGKVDDFDGIFQRLKVEAGPHRIEVRQDGYEELMFEAWIQRDRTTTYEGSLNPLP